MIELMNHYKDCGQEVDAAGPKVELIDGIYPQTGAYIEVTIPHAALNEPDDCLREEMTIRLDLSDVLMTFRGTSSGPAPSRARKDVALLRAYADHIEHTYIKGPTAQPEDMDDWDGLADGTLKEAYPI